MVYNRATQQTRGVPGIKTSGEPVRLLHAQIDKNKPALSNLGGLFHSKSCKAATQQTANRLAQAERTITTMLHDLERREVPSAVKGQIGLKLMNERKTEKRNYAVERSLLMAKAHQHCSSIDSFSPETRVTTFGWLFYTSPSLHESGAFFMAAPR